MVLTLKGLCDRSYFDTEFEVEGVTDKLCFFSRSSALVRGDVKKKVIVMAGAHLKQNLRVLPISRSCQK